MVVREETTVLAMSKSTVADAEAFAWRVAGRWGLGQGEEMSTAAANLVRGLLAWNSAVPRGRGVVAVPLRMRCIDGRVVLMEVWDRRVFPVDHLGRRDRRAERAHPAHTRPLYRFTSMARMRVL